MMDQEWREDARCVDVPTEVFYPLSFAEREATERLTATMCPPCPVRRKCYDTGMAQRPQERQGWWGGVDVEVEFRRRKRIA